jgi:hypothetical protein
VRDHNVVIASLAPGVYEATSAASIASSLLASLPSIRIGVFVGIGGGIARPDEGRDIRLGDIAVSQPDGTTGGVCQYDLIKAKLGGNRERKGFLGRPPTVLLNALAKSRPFMSGKTLKFPASFKRCWKRNRRWARDPSKILAMLIRVLTTTASSKVYTTTSPGRTVGAVTRLTRFNAIFETLMCTEFYCDDICEPHSMQVKCVCVCVCVCVFSVQRL